VIERGLRMTACRVVSFEKGGGLNAGHVAYVWRRGRLLVVLSAHGYQNEPRVRAMMVALATSVPASR
jgi:hypothetical protein